MFYWLITPTDDIKSILLVLEIEQEYSIGFHKNKR